MEKALVYCEGAFGTTTGKTAHGLVRKTERYQVLGVIDSLHPGKDAGQVLDSRNAGIPIYKDLAEALQQSSTKPTHFVMGLAPDGGRLSESHRKAVRAALENRLHVDSGLHDFLSEDPEFSSLAEKLGVRIRDVRKTPPRKDLHSFTGRIHTIPSFRIAVLGTDSAVGKRTTAQLLVDGFKKHGKSALMIGTGQTGWMQGVEFGIILDSLINDFVAGELENAVISAWEKRQPDVMVIEGQGSLMNPAYPGGLEILAATQPHLIVLQHAPARKEYDGFPGFPLHPLKTQIEALELVSGKKIAAVTLNHEELTQEETSAWAERIQAETGLPTTDLLFQGTDRLISILLPLVETNRP